MIHFPELDIKALPLKNDEEGTICLIFQQLENGMKPMGLSYEYCEDVSKDQED
jgi:hypothetical protein